MEQFIQQLLAPQTIYISLHLFSTFITIVATYFITISRPSRAQASSILFTSFAIVYMFGFLLEITSNSLDIISTAIKIEYFGESICIIAFTWFMSEFLQKPLHKLIYYIEVIISLFTLVCLFTLEKHNLFYTSMSIDSSGPFPRVSLEYGVVFYIFSIYLAITFICIMIAGIKVAKEHTGIERRRIYYILLGCLVPWFTNLVRATGITGGYEITFIGILGTDIFVVSALLKYGYFDSVQLAGENALNHGTEGILVISTNHKILYFNTVMKTLFPEMRLYQDAYKYLFLKEIFENSTKTFSADGHTYDMRTEPLLEHNHIQGYMLWAIDMTNHYKQLHAIQNSAHTDELTGLNKRSYFRTLFSEHLRLDGTGTMLMLDVDNFKRVNDTFGHVVGDTVLALLGKSIKKISSTHIACRMGGDEFCIFFKDVTDPDELTSYAKHLMYDFKHALSLDGRANITSLSIGLAILDESVLEEDNDVFDELYRRADRALYTAKSSGKDIYKFYN